MGEKRPFGTEIFVSPLFFILLKRVSVSECVCVCVRERVLAFKSAPLPPHDSMCLCAFESLCGGMTPHECALSDL